eukprot:5794488-Amphidinium_carterae.1
MIKEDGQVLKFPKALNRHRSKLIPLKIGKNYMNMNPAKLNLPLKLLYEDAMLPMTFRVLPPDLPL